MWGRGAREQCDSLKNLTTGLVWTGVGEGGGGGRGT